MKKKETQYNFKYFFFLFWKPALLQEKSCTTKLNGYSKKYSLPTYVSNMTPAAAKALNSVCLGLQFHLHTEILENNFDWMTQYSFFLLFSLSSWLYGSLIMPAFPYISPTVVLLVLFKR